jgi:hypothetical protein
MPPKAMITEPYPGPRPFNAGEHCVFFGRDEETADLRDLIMSYQVVVLYSQSGAGKSSLVRAGLRPALLREHVRLLSARVGGDASPPTDTAGNIYLQNALSSLLRKEEMDLTLSFSENLAAKLHRKNEHVRRPVVIIFDQFEELFTAYPDRWRDREGFFAVIHDAVRTDSELRVVFVLREEHLAELDAYSDLMPLNFRIRYRLERLKEDAALEAIQRPAQTFHFCVPAEDARRLVTNLRQIKVRAAGSIREAEGEYIEPVHLQVICHDMWRRRNEESRTLSAPANVEDIDATLACYYDLAIKRSAREARLRESSIRSWFERELITPRGTRGLVFKGEHSTRGLPNSALALLEQEHIIRSEPRGTDSWYELTHDRLIAPITRSNATWWRRRRLRMWPVYFAIILLMGLGAYAFEQNHLKKNAQVAADRDRERFLKVAADAVIKGDAQASRGYWKEALMSYTAALNSYDNAAAADKKLAALLGRQPSSEEGHFDLYLRLGEAYMHTSPPAYQEAQHAFELAMRDSRADPGSSLLVRFGQSLFKAGSTGDAIKRYDEALQKLIKKPRPADDQSNASEEEESDTTDEQEELAAQTLRLKAEAQLRRGDFEGASESYEKATDHVRGFDHWGELFESIFGFGLVASQQGDYKQGLHAYSILEKMTILNVKSPPRLSREIGFDLLHRGKYPEALQKLTQARKEAEHQKDVEQQAYASLAFAEYHLEKAERKLQSGRFPRYPKPGSPSNPAPPIDKEELQQSLACAQDAAVKFAALGDEVMHGAAFTYQARIRIDLAWFDRAEAKYGSANKEFDQAATDLQKAYDSQHYSERRIGEAYALQAWGIFYETRADEKHKDRHAAIDQYQQAYCVYTSIRSLSNHMREVRDSIGRLGAVPLRCLPIHFDSQASGTVPASAATTRP